MERCARWSSTSPAARCSRGSCPTLELDPGRPGDVLVEVHACGVCRTDLHIRDGELRGSRLPVVPGHQIVATVLQAGPDAEHAPGARVGIPWLGWTDGTCRFCTSGRENLCERAPVHGPGPRRRLRDARRGRRPLRLRAARGLRRPRGGAAAVRRAHRPPRAAHDRRRAARSGSTASAPARTSSARSRCTRAGASSPSRAPTTRPRRPSRSSSAASGPATRWGRRPRSSTRRSSSLPSASSCPAALRAVGRGGVVVCAGIHMSDIPSFPYEILWGERVLRSVANLTRADAVEFLDLAPRVPVRTHVTTFALEEAEARAGRGARRARSRAPR